MDGMTQESHDVKSHEDIITLLDDVRSIEHSFEDLEFLNDIPLDTTFIPTEETFEKETIEPKHEIPVPQQETIQQIEQPTPPSLPMEQLQRQPTFSPLHKLHEGFTNKIATPLLKTPEPGKTTFTLQIDNGKLTGFHQPPESTKQLKALVPVVTSFFKTRIQQIKQNGVKTEIKNITTKIITPVKKLRSINLETIKTIPKKIRGIFSSD